MSDDHLERAWTEWAKAAKSGDKRTLRAAFQAGYEAGIESGAAATGRVGGLKGGKARALKLTKAERSAIAKKAAQARWK